MGFGYFKLDWFYFRNLATLWSFDFHKEDILPCPSLHVYYNNKAAGIISYGSSGGVRAAEALRVVLAELQIASVRTHPAMSLFTDFVNMNEFKPADLHAASVTTLLDQVVAWSTVLKPLRNNG